MITDELRDYVRKARTQGKGIDEITKDLLIVGWTPEQVAELIAEYRAQTPPEQTEAVPASRVALPHVSSAIISLGALVLCLAGLNAYLWVDRIDLSETNTREVQEFYARLTESTIAFTDAGELVFPDEQKFIDKQSEFIGEKRDFIEANLRTMQLTLYEDGSATTSVRILTKGKEGSWWETPTGNYTVLGKAETGYSSIGNVWMPYSVQFYGNYLIHGWPYYDDGTPVPQGFSGGCIRLATEDAKKVYEFAQAGVPVLVLEDSAPQVLSGLTPSREVRSNPPKVTAKSFVIADVATGDIVLEKNADSPLSIASLTKLMTAVVAHEVIYLGRAIKVTPSMLAAATEYRFKPIAGERYTGLDLLYPLLMQSSNDTARVLAGFLGADTFVRNMNAKAVSLGMEDTHFADSSGVRADNVSTTYDLLKLVQYIYFKRPFLFDISKGVAFDNVGLIKLGDTIPITDLKNVNEFIGEPDLIGIKNGETTAAKQTMASVWNLHTVDGPVPVAIVVLGSNDRKKDTEDLLAWLRENYSVATPLP